MSTLRANTLKPITSGNSLVLQGDSGGSGVSGPSIDSNGDVDFSQNTNAKVKLPSGGGIYESDGSTAILTESGGAVSLQNVDIASSVTGFTGFKVVDVWQLKSSLAGAQDPIEAQNLERSSATNGGANFGTGVTLNGSGSADGEFTFPQTGFWRVDAFFSLQSNGGSDSRFQFSKIKVGTSGVSGSASTVISVRSNLPAAQYGDTTYITVTSSVILDVTTSGTSGTIVAFGYSPSGTPSLLASSASNLLTYFVFSRLGDT